MWQFLAKRAWIGILLGLILILLPNTILRPWVPVPGQLPTPTAQSTTDALEADYLAALELSTTDPLQALPLLQDVAFSDHPDAESARRLAEAIQSGRLANDPAYLLTVIGQGLADIGEWRLAQQALLNAVQLEPDYAEAWAYLGEAQQQNGEDGYPALQRALDLNPQSLSALLFTALYWQRNQEYPRAALLYSRAAMLDPENPAIQVQWGENSLLAGDVNKARSHFETAAALSPDDMEIWTYVAQYCIDAEIYVEELGLPASLLVLRAEPQNEQAMVLAGRAYLATGHQVTAEVFLKQAVESFPDYMPAHYYYALFLLAKNEDSLALVHLNKVIALAPGSQEAARAAELIVQYSH
jgi:tetratricopeptide (TPR) repeat protein